MNLKNLLEDAPNDSTEELVENILSGNHFRMERIISNGQASPKGFWYDQDQNEWVLVLKGKGGLMFEGSKDIIEMNPGDYIHIPAHRRHRVAWTDTARETIWLAVHYD
ncbi:MAG: cupin domain-containing protein [Pseudomonadota bacterium]